MATHSSVLAWRIPGTGDPGGLPSMGSHRVGHDWRDLAAAVAAAPWKKSYDKPDRVLKSRDITLLTKVHKVKAMVFPVVVYRCDSWLIKKAEHQRIDAFELWCWRRLLRLLWTAGISNQSILKEINPEYSWKDWCWGSTTLATWCKELAYWKSPWCWERLRAGGGGERGWDGWMVSPTQWT